MNHQLRPQLEIRHGFIFYSYFFHFLPALCFLLLFTAPSCNTLALRNRKQPKKLHIVEQVSFPYLRFQSCRMSSKRGQFISFLGIRWSQKMKEKLQDKGPLKIKQGVGFFLQLRTILACSFAKHPNTVTHITKSKNPDSILRIETPL